jgi:multidrug resistance protein, MATE family
MDAAPALNQQDRSLWHAEFRAMLMLAWPLVLSNLTMSLIQLTDVVLMGRLSVHALAASALGLNLNMALTIFCIGLVLAASPLMAAELGRKKHSVREIRRTFRQSLWLCVSITIPAWILLWNAEPIMLALGQKPELTADAALFLKGYMWSMLPFLWFQAMRHYLAALEKPLWILIVSALAVVFNALLGWALIFGHLGLPRLGIFGGGLATSIVWTVMAIGLGFVLAKQHPFRRYHLFGRWWRADWPRYRALWALGLPIAVTLGFEGTVFSFAIYLMGLINAESVAAHAIALQLAAFTFMVPMGVGQATTVRVGLAFGARDRDGIARAGWCGFALGTGFMVIMAIVMLIIPQQLVGIFLDRADPANAAVVQLAVSFLVFAAIFQIFDGAQVVGAGMLRGLQDTTMPMIFAGIGYWIIGIGVGAGLAFLADFAGRGIWIGLASGLAVVSVLMLARWMRRAQLGLLPETGKIV